MPDMQEDGGVADFNERGVGGAGEGYRDAADAGGFGEDCGYHVQ